jgi:hypothetical protein
MAMDAVAVSIFRILQNCRRHLCSSLLTVTALIHAAHSDEKTLQHTKPEAKLHFLRVLFIWILRVSSIAHNCFPSLTKYQIGLRVYFAVVVPF